MKINFQRSLPKMFIIWLLIVVQACDNDPTPEIPLGADGYFVLNEGGIGNSNTSISFYDREKNTMTNDVFAAKNGRGLGDQAQSATVFEGKAYVAVQNSGKVEVIDADDFSSLKTITEGIESPRYFIGINASKGYLSDWGADGVTGTVKVIDLNTLAVTKTISTGAGANKMLLRDGKVYVANNGGYFKDNKVSIIDTSTDAVTSTIELGDNPGNLQFDKDGNLWVASVGYMAYNDEGLDVENSTFPTLSRIGTDNKESLRLTFTDLFYGDMGLSVNNAGDKLFYNFNGAVYSIATNATTLPTTPFVPRFFYGLAVDPITDEIIGTEALDYSSNGKIFIYSTAGTELRSYVVGIAPSGVFFK